MCDISRHKALFSTQRDLYINSITLPQKASLGIFSYFRPIIGTLLLFVLSACGLSEISERLLQEVVDTPCPSDTNQGPESHRCYKPELTAGLPAASLNEKQPWHIYREACV